MTSKHMIFIVIPKGKFPKTRKQLVKDSGNKDLMNPDKAVYYADEDTKIVFTDPGKADAYAFTKNRKAVFIDAGK